MSEELTPPRFPTMLRKMWSGSEVQAWIDENWNRRTQPEPQAFPPITEQQSQWGRLYTAANALVVQMGYHGSMQADSIEIESLKDKLHDIDGGEWMPGLMPAAQPEPTGSHSLAIKALLYYRDECSGAEPSISLFHQMLDEALLDAQPEPPAQETTC